MPVTVRPATPADVPTIVALVKELAEYENAADQVVATDASMLRALFPVGGGGPPAAEALIGEIDGRPEGLALFFMNFSTWVGQQGVYLEDLFVRPSARGKGLGKALFLEVARISSSRGCTRMDWAVLNWNTSAIEFYKSLGAKGLSEWTIYRLANESLARIAEPR
ncbi:MAG TPA: GNAT family N-acetyltransferase [Phycisphaerales bacterium]|nr:GNAT family N-acetyltransferase [Phycisphaerales bacterium]